MGGKIDAYLDCVSPYSLFALIYLRKNRDALEAHGVEVEFHPVFLGGINVGSGNKPPWTLAAKAKYGAFDGKRAQRYFGQELKTPSFFPILSLLPQRCMTFIKDAYPREKFEESFGELWKAMWGSEQLDVSNPDIMAQVLSRHFPEKDVREILRVANSKEYKQKLQDVTQRLVGAGAFGCPWFEVTNAKNEKEPFFGSDRFHYMWQFLELPMQDIAILPKSAKPNL